MKLLNLYIPSNKFKETKHICIYSDERGLIGTFGLIEFNKNIESELNNFCKCLADACLYIIAPKIFKNSKSKTKTYKFESDVLNIVNAFLEVIKKEKQLNQNDFDNINKKVLELIMQ